MTILVPGATVGHNSCIQPSIEQPYKECTDQVPLPNGFYCLCECEAYQLLVKERIRFRPKGRITAMQASVLMEIWICWHSGSLAIDGSIACSKRYTDKQAVACEALVTNRHALQHTVPNTKGLDAATCAQDETCAKCDAGDTTTFVSQGRRSHKGQRGRTETTLR